ncbi:MAG: alpha/beta fold hydrolase [Acidobacteria bacterium]|nr:alpha/beta fold hydrolase [Acidobacteriota bacterium]
MPRRRTGIRLLKLLKMLLPIIFVLAAAWVGVSIWLVYTMAQPPRHPYVLKPESFSHLSDRGVKVTDEKWKNGDGTEARGWLLRGAEGAPAILLLHRYGADRSWLLNLGVKLNEATNYTILWPDLRGHGENPSVPWTTFGGSEIEDVAAALDYLSTLKNAQGRKLVGEQVGIYGTELGGYAGLLAATHDTGVRALALDSIPATPDELLRTVVKDRTGFDNGMVYMLARGGARLYFFRRYKNEGACAAANSLSNRRVLLLAGGGGGILRDSTNALAHCFPASSTVEVSSDLLITGFNLSSATSQQSEAYDRRVIEFFDKALRVK